MSDEKQEYWMCVIGPVKRSELPQGSDFPLRQAVMEAFARLTGKNAEGCSSGWGLSEEGRKKVLKASREGLIKIE